MKLTRQRKIALAVATVWPFLYLILGLGLFASVFVFAAAASSHGHTAAGFPLVFLVLIPLHLASMLVMFGALVVYIIHAIQNDKLDQNARLLWAIAIFVGHVVAMAVYFYLYILPLQDDEG